MNRNVLIGIIVAITILAVIVISGCTGANGAKRSPAEQAEVERQIDAAKQASVDAIVTTATEAKGHSIISGDKPVITIPGDVKMLRLNTAKLAAYELRLYDSNGKRFTAPATASFGYLIFEEPVKGLTIKSVTDLMPEGTKPTGTVGKVEVWSS